MEGFRIVFLTVSVLATDAGAGPDWVDVGTLALAALAVIISLFAYFSARKANGIEREANEINRDIESGQAGRRELLRQKLYRLRASLVDQSRVLEFEAKVLGDEPAVGSISGIPGVVAKLREAMPPIDDVWTEAKNLNNQEIRTKIERALDLARAQESLIDSAVYVAAQQVHVQHPGHETGRDLLAMDFGRKRREVWDRLGALGGAFDQAIEAIERANANNARG
ncbi:hypothetical protein [Micrococcus luteus]|uniref:hypothetical protein n=1 Tax=Micrococcus luteus TaxID=1270 RepID=UPI0011C07DEA|nr:hypothetical protein [Micrococcus luteus]